jgi:hypothetical protein
MKAYTDNASYAQEIRGVVAELFDDVEWDHSHLSSYTMAKLDLIQKGLSDDDTIDAWNATGLTY